MAQISIEHNQQKLNHVFKKIQNEKIMHLHYIILHEYIMQSVQNRFLSKQWQ